MRPAIVGLIADASTTCAGLARFSGRLDTALHPDIRVIPTEDGFYRSILLMRDLC